MSRNRRGPAGKNHPVACEKWRGAKPKSLCLGSLWNIAARIAWFIDELRSRRSVVARGIRVLPGGFANHRTVYVGALRSPYAGDAWAELEISLADPHPHPVQACLSRALPFCTERVIRGYGHIGAAERGDVEIAQLSAKSSVGVDGSEPDSRAVAGLKTDQLDRPGWIGDVGPANPPAVIFWPCRRGLRLWGTGRNPSIS